MILDGKQLSQKIKDEILEEVKELEIKYNEVPALAIIMVGTNKASEIYVRNKQRAAKYCGIKAELISFSELVTEARLLEEIEKLNNNPLVHGIIVQLPLPKHLNEELIINTIKAEKDVDGFGIKNKGCLFSGLDSFVPATPLGIIRLLDEYKIQIEKKHAVVVGRSNIVGKPIAMLLLNRNATVTIAHSFTENLKEITKLADILVVAVGKANFITKDMVKENAVVIDVGINRTADLLCGDVDFEEVKKVASFITPVPGGVGPLTVALLLQNTLKAFKIKHSKNKGDD